MMIDLLDSMTQFIVLSGSIEAIWNTWAGGNSTLATAGTEGDGTYTYNNNNGPEKLFDNKTTTRYYSRGNTTSNTYAGLNTGFHVSIAQCQPTLVQFRFATISQDTANNNYDPRTVIIEGTNCADLMDCTSWTLLYNGTTGLDSVTTRATYGDFQNITSPQTFTGYRFLITAKKGNSAYVAYSEVELFGY